ncbi:hypothetical protein GALMADRAFT_226853 [Galerina marginata CBS 339.88]|uniref:Protein kinase domain-containing protein n=1 Tax=Galerina marginata (strain CBS 339.88) TaxID=685588 RepID=A0A067SYN6_GALM3|nr:hypothetical protein GALMADRAFT_226853 [Galerina marginata CBS 339.88]
MSEPELYMPDTNDSFDLPRWQTQVEPLSTSSQPVHPSQPSYLYSGPPPPPSQSSAQRMQSVHQAQGPTRQPRISQLLEQEQALGSTLSPYSPGGQSQLTRSTSLGGSAGGNLSSSSRIRRHHQSDDLEGAFNADNQGIAGPRQQPQLSHNSFYSSGAAYQPPSLTGTGSVSSATSPSDPYSDMYYNGSASHPPKRLQPGQHDVNNVAASRGGRSPLRVPNPPISASPLDYSHQPQYSPTTASYPYGNAVEQRQHPVTYQSHSRNHSQVKAESLTPPMPSSYSSQSGNLNSSNYSSGMSTSTYPASYSMDTSSPHPPMQPHLTAQTIGLKSSVSNPPTPLSYMHPNSSQGSHYYPQDQAMAVDPPPKRRAPGFRRVRTVHDLQPRPDASPTGRRMGSDGAYLSPLRQLTTNILDTYRICNPQFRYESAHNPRRVLTKPSKPAHNDGYDNDDYDYILYVNDWLGSDDGHKYLILDILGQGTFGQVVKCQNMKTHEIVAVKVVKNKPAYFNQSMMEVTILELLNKSCDPNDEHHILRLRDSFIHRSHLCLVFELLSSNLYELIKQNQFQGLSTQLVKVFMAQLLDALTVLKDARLIHCDLKPENILLKSLQSPQIKVIDFGSACHERQTVYTYIQSRFYRSPEVLLGMSYTAAIDMWSLGCIAVELFLGLPLFPGTSEYNQLTRIIEMLGVPPLVMLSNGKQTSQFFDAVEQWNPHTGVNEKRYQLKSIERYSREHNTNEQPGKQYFKATSLPEIINTAPMPTSKSSRQGHELEKELNNRAAFIDFCQGLLNLHPVTRWTPQQARLHPFITGEKFTKPFVPDGLPVAQHPPTSSTDPKRPYGGLVPSQPKGTRAYTDAAAYNHHLAQHQAYTAQAQSQAANTFRNPYITPQNSQHSTTTYNSSSDALNAAYQPQQQQPQQPPPAPQQHAQYVSNPPPTGHRGLTHQNSTGQLTAGGSNTQFPSHASGPSLGAAHLSTNLPANPYLPASRARASTINQMDSAVPPALARLQHMNQDVIGGRNALTPVLNRDDAMREWERRQAGKATAAQPYPQLEFLQQQAEMATSSGMSNWGGSQNRYPPPPSKLSHAYQPQTIMVDDDNTSRRDAVMSNVRSVARGEGAVYGGGAGGTGVISSPPQAYASNSTTSGNRYPANFNQNPPASAFESIDRRTDIGTMYVPMQPDPYQSYPSGPPSASTRHVAPPAQAVPPSFYGASVIPSGQMSATQARNPFQLADGTQQPVATSKDARRGNGGIDAWQR